MADNMKSKLDKIRSEAAETRKVGIDKAMNTKGFAEFLAKCHPETDQKVLMEDEAEVEKRFEVFERTNEVKKDLKELYKGHISKEMGITLDAKDMSSIDEYLEKKSIENPEEIAETKYKIVLFKELKGELEGYEKELAKLGKADDLTAKLDALKKGKEEVEGAQKKIGKGKMAWQFIRAVYTKGEYQSERSLNNLKIADTEKQIKEVEQKLAGIEKLEDQKKNPQEMFGQVRKELLGDVSNIAELVSAIQTKAKAQLDAMTKNPSFKSFSQVQEKFDILKNVRDTSETGIDPLKNVDEAAFQQQVDDTLEKVAADEILKAINEARFGDNALSRLEKVLEPYVKREKIGSKDSDQAKDFIVETLEECAQTLGDKTEDIAKKLMISRIIIKITK